MGDRCSFREESVAPLVGDGITYLSSNGPGALALSKTYRDSSRQSLSASALRLRPPGNCHL